MLANQLETLLNPDENLQGSEVRYITDKVSWEYYETLLTQLGDSLEFRLTYLDGILEVMSPSRNHERIKTLIGDLLLIYFLETDTEYYPTGSMTLRNPEQRGGTEPDESYCIGSNQEIPDLAIEVVITSGGINRLEVYQRLGVREVWFWQNNRFLVYHFRSENVEQFQQTSGYELINNSEILPDINLTILAEYVQHPNPLVAAKSFRQTLNQ
ncbi:Uma2 family endonuclease [Planktothrix agardhii]|uniref:Uma2 family endonuclease n=1 Tax=Planktothrix agardhii TaxID=1160 RepID=UPI002875C9D0|nr:Uma2 family endonuclease [Planktothrix agardhii]MDS1345122.1 Uma2 family endonuclease [Planktothrix agardhii NRERC-751]